MSKIFSIYTCDYRISQSEVAYPCQVSEMGYEAMLFSVVQKHVLFSSFLGLTCLFLLLLCFGLLLYISYSSAPVTFPSFCLLQNSSSFSDNIMCALNFMNKPKFLPLSLSKLFQPVQNCWEKSDINSNMPLTLPASPDLFSPVSLSANLSLMEVEVHWGQPGPNLHFCLIP